jgi:hypothetical protein
VGLFSLLGERQCSPCFGSGFSVLRAVYLRVVGAVSYNLLMGSS